ncbi:cytochrome c oxidase subunit NDUFA4 isoform X1 [Anguilla anguilla]|uniref:cytochrome c oxidase subunit NDUFA4 isoform X1 n=2 Tax=Anguilla anguilla TaxID=7936 RepID=UPI0015ADB0AB|nr:cytochrome c oxidase subunit NDUFA4 isoform X1 [Anguilla anguilla]
MERASVSPPRGPPSMPFTPAPVIRCSNNHLRPCRLWSHPCTLLTVQRERPILTSTGNKNPSFILLHAKLIPQFFFTTFGILGATLYLIRLARGPHVSWDSKNNPEPWNKLSPNYQYKLVAVNTDYESLRKEGPDF